MNLKPEKYGKNFRTMIPKKTWESKYVAELKEKACELGDHMADWVEQALEWTQRIANGESWKTICNKQDTVYWHRLVIWKDGYAHIVGGLNEGYCMVMNYWTGRPCHDANPASNVCILDLDDYFFELSCTVPLVIRYE